MAALVDLIKTLIWASVVVVGVWYFRDELKNALKRITRIGFNELNFGSPPEQQIPSSPLTVTAQELQSGTPRSDLPAPKPNLEAFLEKAKTFISADQLDPVLQKLRAEMLATWTNTSDQMEILWCLAASLTVQLGHERNYKTLPQSQWEEPMTEATAILSPSRETQKMLRHRSAVMTLARMRAKKAVLLELRAQGLKPQHFSAREIGVLTDYYLNQHRARLMAEAAEAIATWPGFAQWRLPPGHGEVFVKSTETEHSPNADSAIAGEIANG